MALLALLNATVCVGFCRLMCIENGLFHLEKHCLLLSPLLYLVIPVEMRGHGKALILLKKTEKPLRG